MPLFELVGFAVAMVAGVLGVKENLWHWPISLALHLIYASIFFHTLLYAEMGRELIYFGLAIYGWHRWSRGAERIDHALPISRLPIVGWIAVGFTLTIGTIATGFLLSALGGSVPWLDALIAILSLAARVLFCGKYLECWLLWIIMDLLTIPLLFSRDLPVTGTLYVVYLGMATWGLIRWHRRLKRQSADITMKPQTTARLA